MPDESMLSRGPSRRTGKWKGVRRRVLARDGYTCTECGFVGGRDGVGLEVDHITPRGGWPEGVPGVDHPTNLRTLCTPCHEGVTAMQRGREVGIRKARARAERADAQQIARATRKGYAQVGSRGTTYKDTNSVGTQGDSQRESSMNTRRFNNTTPERDLDVDVVRQGEQPADPVSSQGRGGPQRLSSLSLSPQTAGVTGGGTNLIAGQGDSSRESPTPATTFAGGSTEPARAGWQTVGEVWDLPYDSEHGVWPRFMTTPHPRAVGTYGWEFIEWAEAEDQRLLNPKKSDGLRWWQKMVALRVLEHDEDGRLVWEHILITVARQSGKSWLMRALLAWRLTLSEWFGETQTILHMAHKLQGAYEVWRPATRWAIHHWGKSAVRFANGEQAIIHPDSARWMVQAANDGAGVSMSLGMVFVDEAWRVNREVIDGAVMPTMAEAEQPQLFLVSTAGDWNSDLMVTYRDAAINEVDAPTNTLIMEWSARPEDRTDDRAAWRAASPYWSPRREQVVLDALGRATEAEFRSQWLNQWQPSLDESQALIPSAVWDGAVGVLPRFGDDSSIVVGVEDNFGDGVAVALAWLDPDSSNIAGTVRLFPRLPQAWLVVAEYRERWPNCVVQVGATLMEDPLLVEIVGIDGAERVGTTETRQALPLLRELLGQHRLVHDGNLDLRQQIIGLRVRGSIGGGLGIVGIDERRSDAARAFARAVMGAHRSVGTAPAIY